MSTQPPRRIDRDTAEHLLDGDPAVLCRVGRLAAPLHAVRAPAHPDELVGEQAALAAFQAAADLSPVPQPRRLSMLKIALAKLLTVKASATIIAATGAGGVALAASTGALPNPLVDTPAVHVPATPTAIPTVTPSLPAGVATPSLPAGVVDPAIIPSPELLGLCRAYAAGAGAEAGAALDSPAFRVLITAAGTVEQVDEYCAALRAAEADDRPILPGVGRDGGGLPTAIPTPRLPDVPALPDTPALPSVVPTPLPGR